MIDISTTDLFEALDQLSLDCPLKHAGTLAVRIFEKGATELRIQVDKSKPGRSFAFDFKVRTEFVSNSDRHFGVTETAAELENIDEVVVTGSLSSNAGHAEVFWLDRHPVQIVGCVVVLADKKR